MNFWWVFSLFLLVPVLIHLFDFRRTKKFYFSSIQFISKLFTRAKSKSQLKYYLVLVSRVLLFVCIVSFIWILETDQSKISNENILIYFDNSLSSTLSSSHETLLGSSLDESNLMVVFTNDGSVSTIDSELDLTLKQSEFSHASFSKSRLVDLVNLRSAREYENMLVLTDFQDMDVSTLMQVFNDTSKNYYLIVSHDLNSQKNVIVDSLSIYPNLDELSEVSINIIFRVFNMASGNLVIKLNQADRQLSSIVKDVSELEQLQFSIPIANSGAFSIEIDGDGVSYDNSFLFTIVNKEKPRICIIGDQSDEFIYEVFGNEELFEVTRQKQGNLDYSQLAKSDLIILNNLTELPASLTGQFPDTYFLIIPSDSAEVLSYQEFLGIKLSELPLVNSEIDIDYQHPLFRGVFEKNVDEGLLTNVVPLFQFNSDYESIIKYRGSNSFLLRKRKKYFFNSSISSLSGFQSGALFLPIMYQIAFSSSGDLDTPYYYPGEKVVVNGKSSDNPIKLVNNEIELIPSFNSNGSELVLELPENIAPGFYLLIQNSDTLRRIAINTPWQESIMKAPTIEDLHEAFSDVKNVEVIGVFDQSWEKSLLGSTEQSGLWKYALILAMLFVLTETMLHRFLK